MAENYLTKIGRVFDLILFCVLLLGSFCDAQPQRARRSSMTLVNDYQCPSGYFGSECRPCDCSNITHECGSTRLEYETISTVDPRWEYAHMVKRKYEHSAGFDLDFMSGNDDPPYISSEYWQAPSTYSGNRLTSYGAHLTYTFDPRSIGDFSDVGSHTPHVVLISTHGLRIAYCSAPVFIILERKQTVPLKERNWYHIRDDVNNSSQGNKAYVGQQFVTRSEMLKVLANLKHLMIRTNYPKARAEINLQRVSFPVGKLSTTGVESLVEQCDCPRGYSGLSCENCTSGYNKILNNDNSHQCVP